MNGFLLNLARRGAGLAPTVVTTPAHRPLVPSLYGTFEPGGGNPPDPKSPNTNEHPAEAIEPVAEPAGQRLQTPMPATAAGGQSRFEADQDLASESLSARQGSANEQPSVELTAAQSVLGPGTVHRPRAPRQDQIYRKPVSSSQTEPGPVSAHSVEIPAQPGSNPELRETSTTAVTPLSAVRSRRPQPSASGRQAISIQSTPEYPSPRETSLPQPATRLQPTGGLEEKTASEKRGVEQSGVESVMPVPRTPLPQRLDSLTVPAPQSSHETGGKPMMQVRIGRVEIRANRSPPPPASSSPPPRPARGFDDYLSVRSYATGEW
jgi:hypothetical protein